MPIVARELGPEGALVGIRLGPPSFRSRMLRKHGLPEPEPVRVLAQIDTGAHSTGLDADLFALLGLDGQVDVQVDVQGVLTCSTGTEPHLSPVYYVSLALICPGGGDLCFPALRVLAHTFGPREQARAIIGRDVLERCVLNYDGPGAEFTLAF